MYKLIALAVVLGVVAQVNAFHWDSDSCCCPQQRYRVLQASNLVRPVEVTPPPQKLHTIQFYLPAPPSCTTKAPPAIKLPEIKCPPPVLPLQEPLVLPPSCVCFKTAKCDQLWNIDE